MIILEEEKASQKGIVESAKSAKKLVTPNTSQELFPTQELGVMIA
jgi:hypothetical protein